MFFKQYVLKGTALTPIHIGTGEELEPFNYHIEKETLYVFDFSKFIKETTPQIRTEFLKLIDQNDIIALRRFLRKHIDLEKYSLFQMPVTKEIASEYEAKKDDPKNQLLIKPFIRNETTFHPFIPGSSIKGAIRTAVLNFLLKKKDKERIKKEVSKVNPRSKSQKAEKLILNHKNPIDDPFKAVKITDAKLPLDSTFVAEVFNYNPKKRRFNSMDMRVEMTKAVLLGKPLTFEFELTLLPKAKVSLSLDLSLIKDACNDFYKKIADYEHEKFYRHQPDLEEVSNRLLNSINDLKENSFILRLGRFSHAESMTLEGLRQIAVMGKGRRITSQPEGTTRNLAMRKYPMGWVRVEVKRYG
jgi:CRISPR-associated protein Csm5